MPPISCPLDWIGGWMQRSMTPEIDSALAGDQLAIEKLVALLTPVIQARIARTLLAYRRGGSAGRDVHQEVADLAQEVFLLLFSHDGKVLRSWQPERGLTLENFVGLVAERQTVSLLRSGRRSPWKEDPTLEADLDQNAASHPEPEAAAASRDQLQRLLRRLEEELSPLGRHLFDLIFVQELAVAEVEAKTGLSADAVYAWRSRLRKLARRLLEEG
jgi:RNA polymerase sigma factor (sigma-70 family)